MMRIRELREKRGFTQRELADALGIARTAITNWEKELTLPKAKDLPKLAEVLHCEINELYADSQ